MILWYRVPVYTNICQNNPAQKLARKVKVVKSIFCHEFLTLLVKLPVSDPFEIFRKSFSRVFVVNKGIKGALVKIFKVTSAVTSGRARVNI